MPYNRPSLPSLMTRARQDYSAELPGTDPVRRRSAGRAFVSVQVGLAHGQYGNQQWIANQISVLTCDITQLPLFGRTYQVPQKDATLSVGNMIMTGTNGIDIPAHSELSIGGVLYTTIADATPVGGTVTIAVTAEVAGADGNQDAGAIATFTSPIAGIEPKATVDGNGLNGGADLEDVEAWRQRIASRIGNPGTEWLPQDYVDLALTMPGVTRAWAYPNELDLGMMTVRFVMDDGTGTASIIPGGADVTALQAIFNAKCPAFGPATAVAALATVVAVDLHDIPAGNQTAVEAALAAYFTRSTSLEPGQGLIFAELEGAVGSVVPSGTDWTPVTPTGDLAGSAGHLPVLGVASFT